VVGGVRPIQDIRDVHPRGGQFDHLLGPSNGAAAVRQTAARSAPMLCWHGCRSVSGTGAGPIGSEPCAAVIGWSPPGCRCRDSANPPDRSYRVLIAAGSDRPAARGAPRCPLNPRTSGCRGSRRRHAGGV
jgi:hypothetical protein